MKTISVYSLLTLGSDQLLVGFDPLSLLSSAPSEALVAATTNTAREMALILDDLISLMKEIMLMFYGNLLLVSAGRPT